MIQVNLLWEAIESLRELIEIKDGQDDYSRFTLTKLVRTENETSSLFNGLEWYRSVVWDKERHLPIAISPRKSESTSEFVLDNNKHYYLEDFVEGTMINLWALPNDNKTYVATRSSLGATGTFFSTKSFKTLLDEAWNYDAQGENINTFLHRDMSDGVLSRFMSVVLRHPENRFVDSVSVPEIITIFCGESRLNDDGISATLNIFNSNEINLKYPIKHSLPELSLSVIQETLKTLTLEWGPTWQGLMLSNSDGLRWKFVSQEYSRLRRHRSENRLDVRMIQLLKDDISVTSEYLKYFPEDVGAFLKMEKDLKSVEKKLYNQYVDFHIKKKITVDGLKDYFRPHIYGLHGIFMNILKSKGYFVRINEVRHYLNKQPWQRVLFLVNRMRKETLNLKVEQT